MGELWQKQSIEEAIQLFKQNDNIQAVILKGSCTDKNITIDKWSDIDLLIVVGEEMIDSFYPELDWLYPLGKIFAVEQHRNDYSITIRVCFEDFSRYDLVLIKDSKLRDSNSWSSNPFGDHYKVLYSKIEWLYEISNNFPQGHKFIEPNKAEFNRLINSFWFMGVSAITKVMRDDYLIASHLALEMAQNCIVLEMMLRDRKKGTNIHRVGECENVNIFRSVNEVNGNPLPINILNLIEDSAMLFDRLAKTYSAEYEDKGALLRKYASDAKKCLYHTC